MRKVFPIAASFMLMPSFFFAQTEKQIQQIKKDIDFKSLNTLSKGMLKSKLSTKQLAAQAKKLNIPYAETIDGKNYQLKGFDKKTGFPLYYTTYNVDAAFGTSTAKINSTGGVFNLDGEGMKVHEWDGGGVLTTHQEFSNRVTQKDVPTSISGHATHVAGTMVASGKDGKSKGMAPKARLDAYDWDNDELEMIEAAENGALISNHSYGFTSGFIFSNNRWLWLGSDEDTEYVPYGKYTVEDLEWDLIGVNAPYYLMVKSAGNPRGMGPEPGALHYVRVRNVNTGEFEWVPSNKVRQKNGGEFGFDSITRGALGKNILTVGASHKINQMNGYEKPADVTMASFSAFGPVDDGRIKPDISGIGVDVYSPIASSDNDYAANSGTSMSAPNVTGSLLLLQEHYSKLNGGNFMKASTLKALAIHTANEAGQHDGPDYASGWGLLNAYKAAYTISVKDKHSIITEKSLQNQSVDKISVKARGTEPLIVTIAWTDPVPKDLPSDALNDRKVTLVNDLDVRVNYNGETFYPWKLDPANPNNPAIKGDNIVDNVEQIVIPNPVVGATYEIIVGHKGNLRKNKISTHNSGIVVDLENTAMQDYSMIVTGINQGVERDLSIDKISVNVPQVEYNSQTPVEFTISNNGEEKISGAKIKYQLINTENNSIQVSEIIDLEDITKGETINKIIGIDLSEPFTNYKILGEIILPEDQIELNNKNETSIFGYLKDLTADDSSYNYDFESDIVKYGWISEDKDQDGRTWRAYAGSYSYTGRRAAINFPNNSKKGVDDWLFTNPFKLKAGKTYRVAFNSRKLQNNKEVLGLYLGTQPNSVAMNVSSISNDITTLENKTMARYIYTFTAPSDGIYYIGFNHKVPKDTNSYAVMIDDFYIDSSEAPIPNFKVSTQTANSVTAIKFTDDSFISSGETPVYQWSFSSGDITFENGTTQNSKAPEVIFHKEGVYTATLSVGDSKGTRSVSKKDFITIKNTAARPRFYSSRTIMHIGEKSPFTNSSSGDPAPTVFKWSISPNEGFEYTDGTNDTSFEPIIKFNKEGKYTITLAATNVVGTETWSREHYVEVKPIHYPVQNLKGTVEKDKVEIQWERPYLLPTYFEDFEGDQPRVKVTGLPNDITVIDYNNNGLSWEKGSGNNNTYGYGSAQVRTALAWSNGHANPKGNDEWMILPKQKAGAEVLEYMVRNQYSAELYEIYIAKAPANGQVPTVDELKAGVLVYTSDDKVNPNITYKKHQIKPYTQDDFYIAFRCITPQPKGSLLLGLLAIDDISVGFENGEKDKTRVVQQVSNKNLETTIIEQSTSDDLKHYVDNEQVDISESEDIILKNHNVPSGNDYVAQSYTPSAHFVKYEVEKNGVLMNHAIKEISDRVYGITDEDNKGNLIYTIYAVYSDGTRVPQTLDLGNLSVSEIKGADLKIYPNPSDGRFVIEAKSNISSLKAEVYDMSGKLIFKNEFKGNKADLNLTQYPKGVYILNLLDNNGEKHSAKLMIK